MSNDKAKLHKRRNQPVISRDKRKILLARFNTKSLFQRRDLQDFPQEEQREDYQNFKAVVEQTSFFGIELRSEILLPCNSDLWRKLPSERESSKDAH